MNTSADESPLLPEDLFLRPPAEGVRLVAEALEVVLKTRRHDHMSQLLAASEYAVEAGIDELAYLIFAHAIVVVRDIDVSDLPAGLFPNGRANRELLDREIEVSLDHLEAQSDLLGALSAARAHMDRFNGALRSATRWYAYAAKAYKASGNRLLEAVNRQSLGATFSLLGQDQEADLESLTAQRIYEELGDSYRLGITLLNRAQTALGLGDLTLAETLNAQARVHVENDSSGHLLASADNVSAIIALHRGDYEGAEPLTKSAIKQARNLDDSSIGRVAAQNLAAIYAERGQWRRAERQFRKALDLARKEREVLMVQSLTREVGVAQAKQGDNVAAAATLQEALDLAHELPDLRRTAECQADLGAVLVSVQLQEQASDEGRALPPGVGAERYASPEPPASVPAGDRAGALLTQAAQAFIELGDREWLERVLGNLAVLNRHLNRPAESSHAIESLASAELDARILADIFTESARLALEARDGDRALALFSRAAAATVEVEDAAARAWRLATAAAEMQGEGWPSAALALFSAALAVIRDAGESSPLEQDILNDMALVHATLEQWDEARELLAETARLARAQENRVDLAKSLHNLGEIYRREGMFERATEPLRQAAELQQEIGDFAEAADTWSLLTNTWLILDEQDQAAITAAQARTAAKASGSDEALGRALAARAGVLFGQQRYEDSARDWAEAAKLEQSTHRLEDRANAMNSWAFAGRFDEYQRLFDSFVKEALRIDELAARAGQILVRPARTWLVSGYPRRAARGLAYALALSCVAVLQSRRERPHTFEGEPLRAFAEGLDLVAEALVTPEADPRQQAQCRREMLRQFRPIFKDDGDVVVGMLEEAERTLRAEIARDAANGS